jgi:hypothetical protein
LTGYARYFSLSRPLYGNDSFKERGSEILAVVITISIIVKTATTTMPIVTKESNSTIIDGRPRYHGPFDGFFEV